MLRLTGFTSLVAAVALLLPSGVDGQNKAKKGKRGNDVIAGTPEEYVAFNRLKEVTGKLGFSDPLSKSLSLVLEIPTYDPSKVPAAKKGNNPNNGLTQLEQRIQRKAQEIERDKLDLARARTPAEKQRRAAELQRDIAQLNQEVAQYKAKLASASGKAEANAEKGIVMVSKEFQVDVPDNVIVRRLSLPFEYDDKGNVKTWSDKEKADLKGTDKSLPGYKAKYEDLAPGAKVTLHLSPPAAKKTESKAKETKDSKKDSKEAKEAKKDAPGLEDVAMDTPPRARVRMIVIVDENAAAPGAFADPGPGKKKR